MDKKMTTYTRKNLLNILTCDLENLIISNKQVQFLIFFVFSGFLLRFYHLGFNSLWLDEAATHTFAQKSFLGIWQLTFIEGEFNPPIFYWLEHIILFLGDNEVVLRFIPALAGVLTIPIFYLIGMEFKDKNTGLFLAALLSFSPFHVYYSQEARCYTLLLLIFSIAFLYYLKTLKSANIRNWIFFGVFSSLTFWIHFYALVPIGLLYFHSLIINSKKMKENIKNINYIGFSIFLFFLLSLPLILKAINLFFVRTSSAPTWGMKGINSITSTLIEFSGNNKIVASMFFLLFCIGIILTINKNINKSLLLLLLMFLSLLISYVLSTKMPMAPRYLIYLLPIYFLGIASFYEELYSIIKNRKIIYFLMMFMIIINLPYFSHYYSSLQKDDWRGFSEILAKETHENDIIVVLPRYMGQTLDYYYDNKSDQTYEYQASNSLQLQKIYSQNKDHQIFYVASQGHLHSANPNGDAIQWLQNNTQFLENHTKISLFTSR